MIMVFALVGCGSKGEKVDLQGFAEQGEVDSRATAAQTFGASVQGIESGGEQLNSTAPVEQVSEVYDLGLFTGSFLVDKGLFSRNLSDALSSAGLQQTPEGEMLRLDALGLVDVFGVLSAFEDGPDGMGAYWQKQNTASTWTWDYDEQAGYFDLLLYSNGEPAVDFFGYWDKPGQYLWCQYNTPVSSFEIDVVRTAFGWALQTYEPDYGVVYRVTFCETGSPNGGIGFLRGASLQPRELVSTESIDLPTQWSDIDQNANPTWIMIDGDTLKVRDASNLYSGSPDGVRTYPISGSNGTTTGTTGATLSSDPTSYARVWHGSPVMASGWSERFVLYDDGTFIWGANEMDGASRLRYLAGSWDVRSGTLTLDCYFAVVWEGGTEVKNNGQLASYGSATVIQNPTVAVYQVSDTLELPVSGITHDNERNLDTVVFNELQCWDYSGQADGAVADFWTAIESAGQSSTGSAQKGSSRSSGSRSLF
jgi:hypothetical protein